MTFLKKIIVLLLLISENFYSQGNSGEIIYKIMPITLEIKGNGMQFDQAREIIANAENQTFTLEFNKSKSHFYRNEVLNDNANNKNILNLASIAFTCNYEFYLDKNLSIEILKKNDGNLIKKSHIILDWKILKETKKIDNYVCYKAIYSLEYIARDGKTKTRDIIAWFAPSLPFSYGPKEYNDLPGLILELRDRDTTYYATSIKIKEKEIKINFPEGKTITKEEYDKNLKAQIGM